MQCEDEYLITSLAAAKMLAKDHTPIELAIYSSFFSSLAANIGVIIQNRNRCALIAQAKANADAASMAQQNSIAAEEEVSD